MRAIAKVRQLGKIKIPEPTRRALTSVAESMHQHRLDDFLFAGRMRDDELRWHLVW